MGLVASSALEDGYSELRARRVDSLSFGLQQPYDPSDSAVLQAHLDASGVIAASQHLSYSALNCPPRRLVRLEYYFDANAWQQ